MDEMDKIQMQLAALAQAQSALLNQSPPDISSFQQLATRVSDLQLRMLALAGRPQIPPLSQDDEAELEQAVTQLAEAVSASAGATQILQAATAVANS